MTIDPTSIPPYGFPTIPIEFLLDEAETFARQRIIEAGVSEEVIETCLTGPLDMYYLLVESGFKPFVEGKCMYEIEILLCARNIRNSMASTDWTGGRELTVEEWISYGYTLGHLESKSWAPDTAKGFKDGYNKAISRLSRSKNPLVDKVVLYFLLKLSKPGDLVKDDMARFRKHVGEDGLTVSIGPPIFAQITDDDDIEVTPTEKSSGKKAYLFQIWDETDSETLKEQNTINEDSLRERFKTLRKYLES